MFYFRAPITSKVTNSRINWESWPDEPGMGTLTDEEVAELIKEHGPHWEEEYSHWIGDKVYVSIHRAILLSFKE